MEVRHKTQYGIIPLKYDIPVKGKPKNILSAAAAVESSTCSLAVMSLGQFADTVLRFAAVSFMSQLTEAVTFFRRARRRGRGVQVPTDLLHQQL